MKKLRDRETGEIGELQITEKHYAIVVGNGTANCNAKIYCSLDKLNQEWEDYEEPKNFWYIDDYGLMCGRESESTDLDYAFFCKEDIDRLKEIGNYFETKEEAQEAVEKLKAWKRLKDRGFRFKWCDDYHIDYELTGKCAWTDETEADLDLLFGGEE